MTTQELIASLTAVQPDSIQLDGDSYINWSTTDGDRRCVEMYSDDDAASTTVWMTRADMLRLHAALTATLLRDAE